MNCKRARVGQPRAVFGFLAVFCALYATLNASANTSVPQPQIDPHVIRFPTLDAPRIQFTRITTADGLSETRVSQIVQDDQGFMWFGTQYGLNRYDGYNFKVFVHDPRRPESLGGAFITALFKDAAGNLWVGSNQTLDRLDPRTEVISHFRVGSDSDAARSTVVHISQDRNGHLWLASGTGLYRLDPNTGRMTRYAHDANDPRSLSTNDIKWSGVDSSGQLWVGTANGLEQFDAATGTVKYEIPIGEGVEIRFFEDHLGVFWITYASGTGIAVLDRKSNLLTRYSFYIEDPPPNALTGVMGILEDRAGRLWLGSPGLGLMEFDRKHHVFLRSRNILGDAGSIAEEKVIALAQDREGNIWTGLHSSGPNHFSTEAELFSTYKREAGNPRGLSLDFANTVYPDRDNILWVGNDDGLNRLDRSTGVNTLYTLGLGSKPMVITVTGDTKGRLWIGTFALGLVRFDPKTEKFETYRHDRNDPQSLSNDEAHRVFVDHLGTVWVGTDDGLNRYNPVTDNFTVYKINPDDRHSQSYVAIDEDTKGALWLGTHYSGLHRFDPATGVFQVFKSDGENPSALRDDMVPGVLIDHSGMVWVATQNGLGRLDPRTSKFTTFESQAGLSGNAVDCLLMDRNGTLWAGSSRGLMEYNPVSRSLQRYSTADGLPGNDMTGWATCAKSQTGEMFYSTFAGAVSFFPENMQPIVEMPPVVLTDLEILGSPMGAPRIPMSNAITHANNLTLTYDESIFSIAFAALSYRNSSTVRYRYRLDGLEKNWNEVASDRRRATYTTLPTGKYTFEVQAALSRGPWSDPGAALHIRILAPWWNTWYVRAAYTFVILLGIWWFYRRKLHEAARERAVQMELAHANRVATMGHLTASIAHEVNQPIAATVTNAEAALNWLNTEPSDIAEVKLALVSIIQDGNRAGDIIARIRALIKKKAPAQESAVAINDAILEAIALTRSEAAKNGVSLHTHFAERLPLIRADRVQLQQVLLNLIINAVEALSAEDGARELRISTGKAAEGDAILVAVQDSGPGLAPAMLEQIFEAFYTTKPNGLGLGLSICRSIIEAHGGRLWASTNAMRGSTFRFTLAAYPLSESGPPA